MEYTLFLDGVEYLTTKKGSQNAIVHSTEEGPSKDIIRLSGMYFGSSSRISEDHQTITANTRHDITVHVYSEDKIVKVIYDSVDFPDLVLFKGYPSLNDKIRVYLRELHRYNSVYEICSVSFPK
jgi:hypothetical protein